MGGFFPRDLIKEIKCRPGIYDRDALESPRRDKRHQLWLEVAENLTPAEDWEQYTDIEKVARIDAIQAKWKHLRDHYHRELKLIDAGEAHKKRKYVYFDDMSFMRPFVGFNLPPLRLDKVSHKFIDTMDDSMSADNTNTVSDVDMDALLKSGDSVEEDEKVNISPVEIPNLRPRRNIKPNPNSIPTKLTLVKSPKNQREVFKKTSSATSKDSPAATGNPTFKIRDGDITFSLSLVPTLRKLNDSKKLRAKIEILKVLYKYTEMVEKSHNLNRSSEQTHKKSSQNVENDGEINMQEDHLDDYEEVSAVNVKNEDHDPLNGNTKTWWT